METKNSDIMVSINRSASLGGSSIVYPASTTINFKRNFTKQEVANIKITQQFSKFKDDK